MAPASSFFDAGHRRRAKDPDRNSSTARATDTFDRASLRGRCLRSSLTLITAALSLVGLVSEEEAPRLRLGSRSSAPRPVTMPRLLDRLAQQRKPITCSSSHVIQIV